MGEKESLTLTAHHPHLLTPPLGDLPFDLHHLLEQQNTRRHSTEQSPTMAHEAYMTSQYGSHYQDPHGVGLGIQHVSDSLVALVRTRLTDRSMTLSTQDNHTIRDIDHILDHL